MMYKKDLTKLVKTYAKKDVVINFNSVKQRFCLESNGLTIGGVLKEFSRQEIIDFLLAV